MQQGVSVSRHPDRRLTAITQPPFNTLHMASPMTAPASIASSPLVEHCPLRCPCLPCSSHRIDGQIYPGTWQEREACVGIYSNLISVFLQRCNELPHLSVKWPSAHTPCGNQLCALLAISFEREHLHPRAASRIRERGH
jgi:hypothetical protein